MELTIYIAGPMKDIKDYKQRFANAEKEVNAKGHIALNPAVLPVRLTWGKAMQICYAMLQVSDAIVFLPGWENSFGAKIELQLAKFFFNKKIFNSLEEIPEC